MYVICETFVYRNHIKWFQIMIDHWLYVFCWRKKNPAQQTNLYQDNQLVFLALCTTNLKRKKKLLVWAGHLFVFNVIRSPKQSLGDLLFLLRFLLLLLLFLFFLFFFFLSVHHELVHSRSQELQDRIS